MLLASGSSVRDLRKNGVALPDTSDVSNPKEATPVRCADGSWCLFFEYARDGASAIGLARAPALEGPWTVAASSPIGTRSGFWDSHHLKPGPILTRAGERLMFYNGAGESANWRIGWVTFDSNFHAIRARGDAPTVGPPPLAPGETDMAFVASAFEEAGRIVVYYTVADKIMKRAVLDEESEA